VYLGRSKPFLHKHQFQSSNLRILLVLRGAADAFA
jgi:hypothetical protein